MRYSLIAAVALVAPSLAFAHGPSKGPNGGRMQDAGVYHLELVVNAPELAVYVTDAADKPVDVAGAKGTAIVLANKKQESLALQPAGSAMKARGGFGAAPDLQVVVSLTLPGGKPVQAKFAPPQ